MKFDKQTADRIVDDLSKAKGILFNQRSLGIHVSADKDTIEALRQSDHPDVNQVIGNLLLSNFDNFVYIDGMADANLFNHPSITPFNISKIIQDVENGDIAVLHRKY